MKNQTSYVKEFLDKQSKTFVEEIYLGGFDSEDNPIFSDLHTKPAKEIAKALSNLVRGRGRFIDRLSWIVEYEDGEEDALFDWHVGSSRGMETLHTLPLDEIGKVLAKKTLDGVELLKKPFVGKFIRLHRTQAV